MENRSLFSVDNIDILKNVEDNFVDLLYLDPPFNKNRKFYAKKGSFSEGIYFDDSWSKGIKNACLDELSSNQKTNSKHSNIINFIKFVKNSCDKKSANYMYFMAVRILEIHRILKPKGSVYLHCDNSMSHYLKILMDIIFGKQNFRNEIVWAYKHGGRGKSNFAKKHDIIFWYSKSNDYTFNYNDIIVPFESGMTEWSYTKGKYAGKPMPKGKVPEDVWNITLNSMSKEHIGYPTQKPMKLLERIILASSNEGDMLLDPFCGSGSFLVAAEKLGRQWVGIDLSDRVYDVVCHRFYNELDEDFASSIVKNIRLASVIK